ncbi:MAG: hypothetical protein J6C85_06205 [Alphaproteobacteria bacterium]|nr:hypothetical protein [Alphaproteobacteria bacterium]MBP3516237.1 hypothetical protein [Alphaproteobacteria bacterium]
MDEVKDTVVKVIKLLNEYKVVINKGENDGIKTGEHFLLYKEDEELFDPDTNESLGKLEIVRGVGKVIHLQPKMATIESVNKKSIRTNRGIMFGGTIITEEDIPFDKVQIGDLAKPI